MTEKCFDAYGCVAPKLGARITALEEALQPFAAMFREGQDDNEDIGNGPGFLLVRGVASDMTVLKAKDLRRARAAIAKAETLYPRG